MPSAGPGLAPASLGGRWAMSGLRGKLLLGFGGLLLILVTVSVLANLVLGHYSRSNQRVLREDLSSVSAAQNMGKRRSRSTPTWTN